MANIPIWPGSSSFAEITNPTPFGFYDNDTDFRDDADKVANWVAQRLGYPLVDIELQAYFHGGYRILSNHKWRYSIPKSFYQRDTSLVLQSDGFLGLCGDIFTNGRFDGAIQSGISIAENFKTYVKQFSTLIVRSCLDEILISDVKLGFYVKN